MNQTSSVIGRRSRLGLFGLAVFVLFAGAPAWAQASLTATPNSFTAGSPIYAAAVNANFANVYANDQALNAQLGKLDSTNWTKVTGGAAYSGGNIGITGSKTFGYANDVVGGQFSYDSKTTGSYAIGWFIDSWFGSAASCWLSGWGGIKLFTGSLPRLSITQNGLVGIGTTDPAAKLHVSENWAGHFAASVENTANTVDAWGLKIKAGTTGTPSNTWLVYFTSPNDTPLGGIRQTGTNSIDFVAVSDGRLKTDISDTRYSIADLMRVKVRDYRFKSDPVGSLQTGYIAQELYEVYPAAVAKPASDAGTWGVDYGKLTPLLIKAVQDQQAQLTALRQENADLKARLDAIEQKLGLK